MKPLAFLAFVTWLASVSPALADPVRVGYGPASRIARTADLPGRNVPGGCLVFARALHAKLQDAGFRSRIIEYSYARPATDWPSSSLSHAVVAYEEQGRTYIIDNQSWSPTWIRNARPEVMAQRFSGIEVAVRGARIMPEGDIIREPQEMIGRNPYTKLPFLLTSSR